MQVSTRRRVQSVDRLRALFAELLPDGANKDITAMQAEATLAGLRPRDITGKTPRLSPWRSSLR